MPSIRSNVLPETTASHVMQYSLHVQNEEGRVNLDLGGMDTCVGCRIVEYLLSTVFLLCIVSATSGQYVGACFLL